MTLSIEHDKLENIPENYRDLYTERDGKFYCTGIAGIKTQVDIDRMNVGLEKERTDHKETKEKLRPWTSLGIEAVDVTAKLDRFGELEIAAAGNKEEMDKQLEALTEARITSRLAPVERQNKTLQDKYDDLLKETEGLRIERIQRVVRDDIAVSAKKAGVDPDSMSDIEIVSSLVFETGDGGVVTKKNPYGFPEGLNSELFFQEAKTLRPKWYPPAVGGGAAGTKGGVKFSDNPWGKDSWNVTNQGRIYKEHGQEKAEAMARAAGTVLGGPKPV